jgi:hypothetical protein
LDAQKKAEKEVKVNLSEIQFAGKSKSVLAAKTNRYVALAAGNLSSTTAADIKKSVIFQFTNSYNTTNDSKVLRKDLMDASDVTIDQKVNSTDTTVSDATNKSRQEVFFDPEVIDEVESFTFMNDDPKTIICTELTEDGGQTFASDDQEALRFHPPLHYNCMTFLRPNLRGSKDNPEITGIELSAEARAQQNLGECGCGKKQEKSKTEFRFTLPKIKYSTKEEAIQEAKKTGVSLVLSVEEDMLNWHFICLPKGEQ